MTGDWWVISTDGPHHRAGLPTGAAGPTTAALT